MNEYPKMKTPTAIYRLGLHLTLVGAACFCISTGHPGWALAFFILVIMA